MKHTPAIGLISCAGGGQDLLHTIRMQGYRVAKVYYPSAVPGLSLFDDAEHVQSKEAILGDPGIELVIVCAPRGERALAAECIRADKKVQMIDY